MKRRKTKEKNNPIIDSKAFPNTVTYMPFRLSQSVMQSSSGHENALSSLSAFKMLQIILAQILINEHEPHMAFCLIVLICFNPCPQ